MDSSSGSAGGRGDDGRSRHRSHGSPVERRMRHHESQKKTSCELGTESDRRREEISKRGRRYGEEDEREEKRTESDRREEGSKRGRRYGEEDEREEKRRRDNKHWHEEESRRDPSRGRAGRCSYSSRQEQEKEKSHQGEEGSKRGRRYGQDEIDSQQDEGRKKRRRDSKGEYQSDEEKSKREPGRGSYSRRDEERKESKAKDNQQAEKNNQKRASRWDEKTSTDVRPSCPIAPSTEEDATSLSKKKRDRVIVLHDVFDGAVKSKMHNDDYYVHIKNYFMKTAASCGPVHHIYVDKKYGSVYMMFDSTRTATSAAVKFHRSYYNDKLITVSFYDATRYMSVHQVRG